MERIAIGLRGYVKFSKLLLIVVDAGLLIYWLAVFLNLIPEEQRFRDYSNSIMQAWNWSFFPLDIFASALGFLGIYLVRKNVSIGEPILIVGLTLTFCAGFMAISFWAYYGDFNISWWIPNIFLMLIPLILLFEIVLSKARLKELKNEEL